MLFSIYTPAISQAFVAIQPYVELRERLERHFNPTFSGAANKNRSDLFSRLRVGVGLKAGTAWAAKVEYQNSSDLYWTHPLNASSDNSDLSLGYVRYEVKAFAATGGRQKIELGQQRLIGSTEWLSLARSFDAARVSTGPWDAWFGKLGVANAKPETARVGALTHADRTWGTTSLIFKHDLAVASDTDEQTLDHFVSLHVGRLGFDVEGAVQSGTTNGRDQRAWAGHFRAAYDLTPRTTLSAVADAASGGGNATTSHTFDNLYPSNHDLYGLADLVGWKNMNHLGVALDNHPCKDLTLRLSGHAFTLRDPSDSWYGATGVANPRPGGTFVDPTGASGRDLGKELDVEAFWSLKKAGTVSTGIALFDPGNYVQKLSGTGDHVTYGFVQYQVRF